MRRTSQPLATGESTSGPPGPTMQGRQESPLPTSNSQATAPGQLNPRPTERVASLPVTPQCDEKGCVFPASGPGGRKCLVHDREKNEPEHFESFQPTVLLLDRAKYGLPDPETEPDDYRARDRHRQASEREAFFEGVA